MNNLGKERIAIKTANAVTTILQKQTKEPISLYWRVEHDDGVSDVSSENDIITQDDPKAASLAIANKETTINAAAQEELVDEVHGTMENWSQSENLKNSTEVSNSSTSEVPRISRRQMKPPITKKEDFLW
jgi:hypothetical protein